MLHKKCFVNPHCGNFRLEVKFYHIPLLWELLVHLCVVVLRVLKHIVALEVLKHLLWFAHLMQGLVYFALVIIDAFFEAHEHIQLFSYWCFVTIELLDLRSDILVKLVNFCQRVVILLLHVCVELILVILDLHFQLLNIIFIAALNLFPWLYFPSQAVKFRI